MAVMSPVLAPTRNGAAAEAKPQPLLSVENLTVIYRGEPAVENLSFELYRGERVALIGPNGAGKSTLIQAMLGLLQPQEGRVTFHGIDLQQVGYVPQNEGVNWDFPVTVRDVVMMGRTRKLGWLRWPDRSHWRAVDAALERVGMLAFSGRQVSELSGGQRRRVFIARALAQEANMLVLDEPFSGVDIHAQTGLMEVLDSLNQEGMTILLSTHDLDLAFRRFDKVLALRRRLIAYGRPEAVYTQEVLSQMYGGRLAISGNGQRVSVFVDDHSCTQC